MGLSGTPQAASTRGGCGAAPSLTCPWTSLIKQGGGLFIATQTGVGLRAGTLSVGTVWGTGGTVPLLVLCHRPCHCDTPREEGSREDTAPHR